MKDVEQTRHLRSVTNAISRRQKLSRRKNHQGVGIIAGAKYPHGNLEAKEGARKASQRSPQARSRSGPSSLMNQDGERQRGCNSWDQSQEKGNSKGTRRVARMRAEVRQ